MIEIEIRPAEYQVLIGGRRVPFTVREFQTFQCLAASPDRVLTRADIYACVWGGRMGHRDRSVDVFVRKVRTKLALICPGFVFVHTHFGIGYRYAPEPALAPPAPPGAPATPAAPAVNSRA